MMTTGSAARRFLLTATGGVTGAGAGAYACYKAKYDPPHLIWDLDNTLLCSVTPLPSSTASVGFDSFDQIDDDFPVTEGPNTRTYWRPGARTALQIFRWFTIQHVFTAAQATYTENILNQMDRSLFHTIIHRDLVPQHGGRGKDIQETIKACGTSHPNIGLHRCILFDDRIKNFQPQQGQNGLHVVPFEVTVETSKGTWVVREYKEIARWMGIAVLALLVPDVRSILSYFQSKQHKERFST